MTMYETKQIQGWAAVTLEGPTKNLQDAQASLKVVGLTVDSVGNNSILLRDVRDDSLANIEAVAQAHGMRVVAKIGSKTFLERRQLQHRKAFKLNLEQDKWYFAENIEDTFPFVVVRDIRIEKTGNNGDTDQLLELEFYGPNHAMPIKQTVSSREAAEYGMRPATEDDFENVDMIVPVSQLSTMQLPNSENHGIPTDMPPVNEKPKPIPSQLS